MSRRATSISIPSPPTPGSIVRTPDGEGTVLEVNVVAGTLKVRSNVEILAPRVYKREECVYLRGRQAGPQSPRSRKGLTISPGFGEIFQTATLANFYTM